MLLVEVWAERIPDPDRFLDACWRILHPEEKTMPTLTSRPTTPLTEETMCGVVRDVHRKACPHDDVAETDVEWVLVSRRGSQVLIHGGHPDHTVALLRDGLEDLCRQD